MSFVVAALDLGSRVSRGAGNGMVLLSMVLAFNGGRGGTTGMLLRGEGCTGAMVIVKAVGNFYFGALTE